MAITREELKVGGTYLSDEGHERTILGIGESHIFYKNGIFETTSCIDVFIKRHCVNPKPKEMIKMKKIIQKIISLTGSDGQYYNFFNTPGSIGSLNSYLDNGWIVMQIEVNSEYQTGWVLLEKAI